MGGSVGVTLRLSDGQEYRMIRWTNSMPWGITNMGMVRKDPEHIQAYLRSWLEMKDDWDRNHATGQFEHNMTDFYVPYDNRCLHPREYGLVVVDLLKDRILTMQDYTTFGKIYDVSVGLDLRGDPTGNDPDSNVHRLRQFYEAGRSIRRTNGIGQVAPPTASFQDLLRIIESREQQDMYFDSELDMSPLVIEEFDRTVKGSQALRRRVLELGFSLSDREVAEWDEFDDRNREYENEESEEDAG